MPREQDFIRTTSIKVVLNILAETIDTFLQSCFKKKLGFCLIVFPFHLGGIANYVSNAEREDMINALEETVLRLKNNQDNRKD